MPPLPAVLSQHAEEAAFLWLLRDAAVIAPHHDLPSITRLDQRVEAHLDGLRVAGADGWQAAWQEFQEHPEPGEAFTAAVLALESADPADVQAVLDAVGSSRELTRAIVSAVGWLTEDTAAVAVPMLFALGDPIGRRIAVAGASVRRSHPGTAALDEALRDSLARVRAIEAIGELGDSGFLERVRGHMTASDADVRAAAAWTVARIAGDSAAISELQAIAMTESLYRIRSADLVVRRLEPASALRWVTMLEQIPGCERVAIHAAGALGDPAWIPKLIEKAEVPTLARAAGEALSLITSVHISYDKLERDETPEGFQLGPTEDASDDRVEPDPDDGLAWPDPERIRKWWAANREQFHRGVRHLCGQPITQASLQAVLQRGYQRQRTAAALEMAVRIPQRALFEVRSPGWRQQIT
jgi:uncharacterized protein (TIGR02270 family)